MHEKLIFLNWKIKRLEALVETRKSCLREKMTDCKEQNTSTVNQQSTVTTNSKNKPSNIDDQSTQSSLEKQQRKDSKTFNFLPNGKGGRSKEENSSFVGQEAIKQDLAFVENRNEGVINFTKTAKTIIAPKSNTNQPNTNTKEQDDLRYTAELSTRRPEEKNIVNDFLKDIDNNSIKIEKEELPLNGNTQESKQLSFDRTCEVLESILKGDFKSLNYNSLKPFQKELIVLIIHKNFKDFLKTKSKQKKQMRVKMKELLTVDSFNDFYLAFIRFNFPNTKRKEEKLKFIFKNGVCFFRKRFYNKNSLKFSTEGELLFLNDFFSEHIKKYDSDATCFSDPLSNYRIKNNRHSSLTKEYFKEVFSIEEFKQKFFSYLDNGLKTQYYMESMRKKIKRFLGPLKQKLRLDKKGKGKGTEEGTEEECYREFMGGLSKWGKLRLPWFDREMENAIETFKIHINNILKELT